jgi:8-hydroxy-5-deazaflavin:NADPH oxidoreductase
MKPDDAELPVVTSQLETRREAIRGRPLFESASALPLPRIAVLGAGHVGPVIARAAIAAGHQVAIAASGDPENIELVAQVLAPGAEPRWAADAVEKANIVVLAIPLHKFATFDSSLVADKLVVDAMNYWPPIDGVQELFEDREFGSSEIVAHRLSGSTVVKTLNHIGYHDLEDGRRPVGSPERRSLGVAGDDTGAVDAVAEVIERIGYDAVRLDSLRAGRVLEPGGPVFGVSLRRAEFEVAVRAESHRALPLSLAQTHSK